MGTDCKNKDGTEGKEGILPDTAGTIRPDPIRSSPPVRLALYVSRVKNR